MHWIEVLNAYGQVDANVTANVPEYTVFNQPSTGVLTFVASNTSAVPENNVQFMGANGNVLLTETVPAYTTLVTQGSGSNVTIVAQQTTPNFSLATPQNRFYLTTSGDTPTLSYGKTGNGEDVLTWDGSKPLQFTIKGITGTLSSQNAVPDFSLWFDPGTRTNSAGDERSRYSLGRASRSPTIPARANRPSPRRSRSSTCRPMPGGSSTAASRRAGCRATSSRPLSTWSTGR